MTEESASSPSEGSDGATGTFLVTAVDEESAILRDVETAQIHPLATPADLTEGEVVDATLEQADSLGVTWQIDSVTARRTVPVERSPEAPTTLARDLAADHAVGDLIRHERAGDGELHVLSVPAGETETAAEDVRSDDETVARAARFGVDRVEVRAADGVVSVRYLP